MEKTTKQKAFNRLRDLFSIYWILHCLLTPFVIGVIPMFPTVITHEPNWMWFMFVSLPVGITVATKFWDIEFISKHL